MKLVFALVVLAFVAVAYASSHSEAPGTAKSPQADHTDFYMFRSYEPARLTQDYVTFLVNVQGLQSPYGGPNYYSLSDQHFYEIYIENTGDGIEDLIYQFMYGTSMGGKKINTTTRPDDFDCTFTPQDVTINGGISLNIGGNDVTIALKTAGPITATDQSSLNWFENYFLTAILGNQSSTNTQSFTENPSGNTTFTKPFDNAGEKTFPDYDSYADQYIYNVNVPFCQSTPTVGKVFVGQRRESFFINLGGIFDLINFVPIPGFPGAIAQNPLNNDLINKNIDTFALEIPSNCLTATGVTTGVIGAWGVIRTLLHIGAQHVPGIQVSRLGNPLINELVIGLYHKYQFNAGQPINDGLLGNFILYPTMPEIVNILFGSAVNAILGKNYTTIAPDTPRLDLLMAFAQGIPGVNQLGGSPPAEMMRLNLSVAPRPIDQQFPLGVIAGDPAGFPNGRRPGDDSVDIGLQVLVAGVLCTLNIGCAPGNAPIGAVALYDGAPISASDFQNKFPYLNSPIPGALNAGHDYSSPSGGLSVPSVFATLLALAAGFLISIAFFKF